jgi:cytochrome P450
MKPSNPDVMTYLDCPDDRRPLTLEDLVSDALISQLGGSDTTTSMCVHILYHLALYQEVQSRLFAEISEVLSPGQLFDYGTISPLKYLEAVIKETLRLYPPAPTGLSRKVPLEGIAIGGVFVVGGVDVSTPTYSLHRDPRYFVDPERFIPERRITGSSINLVKGRPEMIIDRTAFFPFGFGPYGCAGKHLAYVELKLFVAAIVRSLEVKLLRDTNVEEVERRVNGEWRDYSTLKAAPLTLRFLSRA